MSTKRQAITDKMKWRALFYRFPLPCAVCGVALFWDDDIEWDHIHSLVMDGAHHHSNIRPLHANCHTEKTIRDIKANAKTKRLERERAGLPKRKRPKKKIHSAGFNPNFTRKFSGEIIRR